MRFISYYTENTPYQKVMLTHLFPSVKACGLDYYIKPIKDLGNWNKNTSYKSQFIKEAMEKYKEDVVFLDADSIIHRRPRLFFELDKKYDIAVHYLDWNLQWRGHTGEKRELLSGTMMFRYNDKILTLLDEYIETCEKNPNVWEQKLLQTIISNNKELKVYNLPATYCTVILHNGKVPPHIKKPVIVHYQASRKFKK